MKRLLLISVLLMSYSAGFCQALNPDVIVSSGGFSASEHYSICWSLGECVTESFDRSEMNLTQGFQQNTYEIETLNDHRSTNPKIIVYPNPAIDFVYLELQIKDRNTFSFQLCDLSGHCLINGKLSSERTVINLSNYAGTAYLLNVLDESKQLLKSFKLIKTN